MNVNAKIPGGEIDKAAAELVTTALNIPAKEASGLLGDVVGVIADRLKVFRYENRIACILGARNRLAAKGIQLEDAKRISEGNVYDLLDGMGSAENENIRKLWSGLLANAMDPKHETNAERPHTETLRNLTKNDVLILEFLAAFVRFENWEMTERNALPQHSTLDNEEKKKRIKASIQVFREKVEEKREVLQSLFNDLGIDEIQKDTAALLNLRRLGLIESVSERDFGNHLYLSDEKMHYVVEAINELREEQKKSRRILAANDDGQHRVASSNSNSIIIHIRLGRFGVHFAGACGLLEAREPI